MEIQDKLLRDVVAFRTYAKYIPHFNRRESLEETVNRNMRMHLDRFPELSKDITFAYTNVHEHKVMPSMRAMQFAGEAITRNNARLYNCSGVNADSIEVFGEAMFLLLSGAGVGYSVQSHHVNQLPSIREPRDESRYLVADSIEGWGEAINSLMFAYFKRTIRPVFDFTQVREKGSYLSTTGAKAPGAQPLKKCLERIEEILKKAMGRKLKTIEVFDIMCIIADAVLAGGIRRAATICMFDRFDEDMLTAKTGEWWVKHPHRAMANISAVLPKDKTTKEEFFAVFQACKNSGAGEPGISWTNNTDWVFNPCHEISLRSNTFCNLTTMNLTGITSKKEFMRRIKAATILATLQASYTDFPFLREIWTERTQEDSLIGVSMTGIADNPENITEEWLQEGAELVKNVNAKFAKKLGINPAKRCTTNKPEGSASCVLGSSSGIHARHGDLYLRRVRMNKDDKLASYFLSEMPDLVEDDVFSSDTIVVTIPQKSPKGSITRENETAVDLFNRIIKYNKNWVQSGHIEGDNFNNVSATISVKEEEWDVIANLMWDHREDYTGISLLPYDGGTYKQAPFESCDQETFDYYMSKVKEINLSYVKEETDNTEHNMSVACSGGVCSIV